MIYFTPLTCII